MYKNISFQEAEFGEKKFLMYRVDDAAQMDHVEVEMLKNNDIKGLLPFSSAQNNDEIKFMYEMTNKMKLSQFLGGLVRWEELYPAVSGWGVCVQGLSRVQYTVTAAGAGGASVQEIGRAHV